MARTISGPKWDEAVAMLRAGYSRTAVCRTTGISHVALRAFLQGDPSSSGRQWFAMKRELAELDPGPRTTASA